MMFFMDLLKGLDGSEHAETIAVTVAETRVAINEADDVFPSCAVDVSHD